MFKEPFVKWVFGAAVLMFAVMVSIYMYQLGYIFPSNATFKDAKELREAYGVIGDFFGGVLNPLLTFCGFGFLIYTINQNSKMLSQSEHMLELVDQQLENAEQQLEMTRKEMELSRSEMEGSRQALQMQAKILEEQAKTQEIQRFESTFFSFLKLLDSARALVHFKSAYAEYVGATAFEYYYNDFNHSFILDRKLNQVQVRVNAKDSDGIGKIYKEFINSTHGILITQYCKMLEQVLQLVHLSEINKKGFYIELLKAQLSRYELLILFYYCFHDDSKMVFPLIKEYDLLQHLEKEKLPEEHLPFLEKFKPEPPQQS